jgi:hypothetical protein|tara:strand:- start:598 stop:2004 length:1407 start_codon:yes stop_codon:yes gene_type:complete
MKKYLLTFLVLLLISCSSENQPVAIDSEESSTEVLNTDSTTSSSTTSTTTTVLIEEPYALDEFGLELQEPPLEMKEQLVELMAFIERRIGLEYTEDPLYHLYTLNDYQEYNALSFLDDFEEDYEDGEWERAVLSENMWGLNDFSPDQLLNLQVEFQRCFSAGSYNLLDKILRLPIRPGQKKLNFYEQRVIVHELVHSLQGQHFEISEWYQEMDELDDFSNYPGIRALMEAQADWVEGKWVDGLDSYDRQTMQAQIPNISCRVALPTYFYIPSDLYYTYGPILAREIINQGKMTALNEALSEYKETGLTNLPTSEQIYDSSKFFTNERYEAVDISTLTIPNFELIDEGTIGSLDLVYLLQSTVGPIDAITAAVGIGGGSWKDYTDSSGNLIMTVKISGDTSIDLDEIYQTYILWAESQQRFTESEMKYEGTIYKGSTNVWISRDSNFVKLVLTQDMNLFEEVANQLGDL